MSNDNQQRQGTSGNMKALGIAIGFIVLLLANAYFTILVLPTLVNSEIVNSEVERLGGEDNYNKFNQLQREMIKDSFGQKELQSSINKYSNENQATTEDKVNRAKNSLQSDKITQSNIRDSINTTSKGKTLLSEEEISSILKKRQIAQKYLIETGDYDIFSLPPQDLTEQLR